MERATTAFFFTIDELIIISMLFLFLIRIFLLETVIINFKDDATCIFLLFCGNKNNSKNQQSPAGVKTILKTLQEGNYKKANVIVI